MEDFVCPCSQPRSCSIATRTRGSRLNAPNLLVPKQTTNSCIWCHAMFIFYNYFNRTQSVQEYTVVESELDILNIPWQTHCVYWVKNKNIHFSMSCLEISQGFRVTCQVYLFLIRPIIHTFYFLCVLIATDSPFLRHPVEMPRVSDASSQYMIESTVKWSDFDFGKEAESWIIFFSQGKRRDLQDSSFLSSEFGNMSKVLQWEPRQNSSPLWDLTMVPSSASVWCPLWKAYLRQKDFALLLPSWSRKSENCLVE